MSDPDALTEIAAWSTSEANRAQRASAIAAAIRSARGYRWVGVYDVGEHEVAIVGWAGGGPPAYPKCAAEARPLWGRT